VVPEGKDGKQGSDDQGVFSFKEVLVDFGLVRLKVSSPYDPFSICS